MRVLTLIGLLSGNCVLTATAATTFDFVQQFSTNNNPSGVWSYGYKATADSSFSLFATNVAGVWHSTVLFGQFVGASIWANAPTNPPSLVLGCVTVQELPTLRFTAPQSGFYSTRIAKDFLSERLVPPPRSQSTDKS